MRINRFTPRISDLFNVAVGDEGRSITDFTHRLDYDDLAADARKVLRDLTPSEREVHGKDGDWYLTRLRPYRTVEDKIDGVVVTFVDIGERRRAEDALRESEAQMRVMVDELQHRTRNLIAVVMALVDRTSTSGQTVEQFKTGLSDRLMALARAQRLLSRGPPGDGVTFDALLQSEISAQSENDGTVALDGPSGIVLNSISVQALAMALHELTTNAVKYGALGHGGRPARYSLACKGRGRLVLDCYRLEGKRRPGCRTSLRTEGRREWPAPHRGRFALSVWSRTTFAIEPDGLHCTIALPLS